MSVAVLLSATMLLVPNLSIALTTFSPQPPVDISTYRAATIGQPRRLDPSRAYDTASGEIIQNVYQSLIFFADKPLPPSRTTEITDRYIADLGNFTSVIATKVPSTTNGDISPDGKNWTFTIRSNVAFHDWAAANGSWVRGQILTTDDVVYTFKRMLVQDMQGGPSWMIALPAIGRMLLDDLDANASTNTIEPVGVPGEGERLTASLIDSFITSDGTTVTFHWASAWAETPLKQILSQSWSCIVNKAFCIEHGCWNGSFYDGWSTDYRRMPSTLYSPLDRYHTKSRYSSHAPNVPNMCGTGPYKFISWDKANAVWRIDKFANYWGGWDGSHVTTVIETSVAAWPMRKELFLSGEFDDCLVPRENMFDLLDPSDPTNHIPLPGITLYYNAPSLSNEAMLFVQSIDTASPYMPKNGTTPEPDLFANVHMRRAFAHALNFTQYLEDAWSNEAIQPASWWVKGLKPDYENKTLIPHDLNTTAIQEELEAAGVWDEGFETTLVYVLDHYRTSWDMMAATFASLGSRFKCNVVGIDWPTILDYQEKFFMPVFSMGWGADFGDPENFARTYMHSRGNLASMQRYNDVHVDYLVDLGINQPDGPARNATYQELQYIYWRDVPSLPLIQSVSRRWQRNWVGGWYYNPVYPGLYFYDLYKTRVHNLDTGLSYATIQEAINAPETIEGQTILVEAGAYYENIVVNKSISLKGSDRFNTIIDGNHVGTVVNITANNVNFTGFAVQNSNPTYPYCGVSSSSSGNNIGCNIITANALGIQMSCCSDNTVTENIIFNNQIGIYLQSSSNNSIYHNDFINNTYAHAQTDVECYNNTWNNGYPSGGNYWSDYTGTDTHSGVHQNETGSDGIGDTPIHGDRYPLMAPHIIPEISSAAMFLLLITVTLFVAAFRRKRA